MPGSRPRSAPPDAVQLRARRWLRRTFWGMLGALAGASLGLAGRGWATDGGAAWFAAGALGIGALLLLPAALRLHTWTVTLSAEGLAFRSGWLRRTARWDEVAAVRVRTWWANGLPRVATFSDARGRTLVRFDVLMLSDGDVARLASWLRANAEHAELDGRLA